MLAQQSRGDGAGTALAASVPLPARRDWPLSAALVGAVLGVALQLQQAQLWPWPVYAVLFAAGLFAALGGQRTRARWHAAGLLFVAAALLYGLCGLRATAFLADALDAQLEGQDLQLTGVIAAMPQSRETGLRLRLAVESARRDGVPVRLPPLIDLSWYASGLGDEGQTQAPPTVHAGERWRLTVRLKAPHGGRNPHGFDYELWLWEQGVQATGYVRTSPRLDARHGPPERLAATWQYPVEQLREKVRDAILRQLAPGADSAAQRAMGVVAALVTGDQRAIERADWDVFRATGVAHLMAISGLHITLFAWLAAAVIGQAWRRSPHLCLALPAPTAALVGGVLLAGAYALFSGWGVPAQRTVCMLATVALLRLSGRRWPWPQVWLLACAVVLLADPWALLQAGFWLSFVAVAVLFASDTGAAGARPASVFGRFLALLREQWVVTVALTPLTLLLFGQVSLVGLLANLLAIPWTTLVVTPLALLGVLGAPLWQAAAWCVEWLTLLLQWLAGWPWAQIALPLAPLWAGMAAVAGGVLLALRLPWGWRALGLPLLLPALWWQAPRPPPGQFELLAADVGQGQAVLVRTAGHALLYDAGPRYHQDSDAGERVLVPLLRALGERLDLLLLSHRDSDHTGGAAAVLAAQPQARLLASIEADHALQALRPIEHCVAGQAWQWDGVRFEVLHPPPAGPAASAGARPPKTNALSCVLRITAAAGASALLVGDIERAQEQALLAAGAPLAANLLLVPHHGSKTSSSEAFIDAVRPQLALVQAGYRNRFGHPAPEVAARYEERGIALVQSPHCGAARWASDAPQAVHCERQTARRYWHHRLPTD
ncbi:MAG: DNA internalization-related competence protein ComEC/Rec2 [Proteobacteria bacterium]|nr:DNA internalization-related competence protein ComEC/Rec2 [Pseudomonadota bacterium]MBS0492740.1 DNA internalization-related competence protein ComEC/Rec2 [Pseudomonadota bacterium]